MPLTHLQLLLMQKSSNWDYIGSSADKCLLLFTRQVLELLSLSNKLRYNWHIIGECMTGVLRFQMSINLLMPGGRDWQMFTKLTIGVLPYTTCSHQWGRRISLRLGVTHTWRRRNMPRRVHFYKSFTRVEASQIIDFIFNDYLTFLFNSYLTNLFLWSLWTGYENTLKTEWCFYFVYYRPLSFCCSF